MFQSNTSEKSAVPGSVSAAEWQARTDLAACYRVIAHYGLQDRIYTHISARVPGEENAFLVNPFGLMHDEITASRLVKVDVDGNILTDSTGFGINPAAFVIHGAIHAARHDVHCVLHTHTPAGIAVSAQTHGLLPLSLQAAALIGDLAYHEFEGISVHVREQERLVADLNTRHVMILNNHGLLTAGRSTGEALSLMLALELSCRAQVQALSAGSTLRLVSAEAISSTQEAIAADVIGNREWSAMLRLAERIAPDFRD